MKPVSRESGVGPVGVNRREFLVGTLAAGGGLALASVLPFRSLVSAARASTHNGTGGPLPGGLDPAFFHLYSETPLTLGTRRSAFGMGVVTPVSRFFVRNNLPMPPEKIVADPDSWSIEIEGVRKPRELTLGALKTMGVSTITTVIQCSGNGRAFFEHKPSGSPWKVGAAGCAIWTGLPVGKLLEAMGGPSSQARYLTGTGGEEIPDGLDRLELVVERSVPIEKGISDCLLAWEMNGEPIPLIHGGPLRLIVPGYYGCNQIKYIDKLACTKEQSAAKIQQTGYRMRPIGKAANSKQPSMWRMSVTSWLQAPGGKQAPVVTGTTIFHGVAFSGERRLAKIEFSQDGGKHWEPAKRIGPEMGINAWHQFYVEVELGVGRYTLVTRATDDEGDVQPANRYENERGYGNNSWRDLALSVVVVESLSDAPTAAAAAPDSPPIAASAPLPDANGVVLSEQGKAGRQVFMDAKPDCGACHSLAETGSAGTLGPNFDELRPAADRTVRSVTQGVGVMPSYRDTLSTKQIENLAQFLSEATARKP